MSGREAEGAGAKGRLAAISDPSQPPSPGPVFIPPPRLLTHVADTRPVWPRPQARRGGRPLAACPGEATEPARGPGGGRGAPPDGLARHLCWGAAAFAPLMGTPAPRCSLRPGVLWGRGVQAAASDSRMQVRAAALEAGVPAPSLPAHPPAPPAPHTPRPQVHHRQRSGGELRGHLLQRRLL